MAASHQAIVFNVAGSMLGGEALHESGVAGLPGDVLAAVRCGAERAEGPLLKLEAIPGEDVVVIQLADGPRLVLHPASASDLLKSNPRTRTDRAGETEPAVDALPWAQNEQRGAIGAAAAAIKWLAVVKPKPADHLAHLATAGIVQHVDGQVEEGVYSLPLSGVLSPLKGTAPLKTIPTDGDQPILVLLHGTFVDTASTFGKLWSNHPQVVKRLAEQYHHLYALDHATLGAGPVANALTLARALAPRTRLHLLCHSRGGLVAEVLVRAAARRLDKADEQLLDPATHRQLAELNGMLLEKQIVIERVVRVACPARGTLLASGRLDAYLSVLQWLLEQAHVPIVPQLVEFLYHLARNRTDIKLLPGLEAMTPSSALIAWLNTPTDGAGGELRVVAGDSQGGDLLSWLKTLLADAFYWTDNDLVVQTRSMYGGMPRLSGERGGALFYLARGDITHFSYFSQAETVEAIESGLLGKDTVKWSPIGPLSWLGKESGGVRGAQAPSPQTTRKAAERPAVIVLPDFLGSQLYHHSGLCAWLTPRSLGDADALCYRNGKDQQPLRAEGLNPAYYGELTERLRETHEVLCFGYDWRRPITEEAVRLAALVRAELSVRNASLRPVRLLAHGMGGLLVRAMQFEHPDTWLRLMAREGARLLMLGTPHAGSWAPMQLLTGDDAFGNTLSVSGPLFGDLKWRKVFAGMPGLLQLQAGLLDPMLQLDQQKTWERLAREDGEAAAKLSRWHRHAAWGIPPQQVLDQAVAFRRELDGHLAALTADAGKMAIVVGRAPYTPNGFVMSEPGLLYQYQQGDGDGRVTLASARLRGVKAWQVEAEHGMLPSARAAFSAYIELLNEGRTELLPGYATPENGNGERKGWDNRHPAGAPPKPRRPAWSGAHAALPNNALSVFETPDSGADTLPHAAVLAVRVQHGNLKFIPQPLLVGHYQALSLSGAEDVVDGLVDGRMRKALRAGLYPEAIGSCHVFANVARCTRSGRGIIPRPKAVTVVGLGEEGKLKAAELSYSVRLGVLAYAERYWEEIGKDGAFEIAATLIGSGGTGISVGNAALSIVQGVIDANVKLAECGWQPVRRLILIELYLDRATDAWRVLTMQSEATPERLCVEGDLIPGEGSLRRPLESSYRGATYDFITALHVRGEDPQHPCIAYSLDSKRARTEVRAQRAQGSLVRDLVAKASNSANTDAQIGRTLFQLLVPVEIEPYLAGSTDMVIELDRSTAALPWELLDTDAGSKLLSVASSAVPWSIRTKLIRRLQVAQFRAQVVDATTEDNVLVIGEPLCDPARYGPLPGARREALAVAKVAQSLGGGGREEMVQQLADHNDAQTIINALFARNYRAIHIAGHGMAGKHGGVVLSGPSTFLGADEIRAMRVAPELVFLNCCHLAHADAASALAEYDRTAFAANLAEELIRVGVRCVIAAGWAVEDAAAEKFATAFYAALFGGARFIDAVGEARRAAWEVNRQGNTWAAYQCYGDPEWSWRRAITAPQPSPEEEYAGIASSANLLLVLEGFATESDYANNRDLLRNEARLRYLDEKFGAKWGRQGEIAEAFGKAYAAMRASAPALKWYLEAIRAANGCASLSAMDGYAIQLSLPERDARDYREAIHMLRRMTEIAPSLKRHTIMAVAYKRLSTCYVRQGRLDNAEAALQEAEKNFGKAIERAHDDEAKYKYYPTRGRLACELRRRLLAAPDTPRALKIDEQQIQTVRESIRLAVEQSPTFWSIVAQSELELIAAVANGELHEKKTDMLDSLEDLYKRISAPRFWMYVHDDARFLLEPYRRLGMVHAAERQAADDVLRVLARYSEG